MFEKLLNTVWWSSQAAGFDPWHIGQARLESVRCKASNWKVEGFALRKASKDIPVFSSPGFLERRKNVFQGCLMFLKELRHSVLERSEKLGELIQAAATI